MEDNYKVLIIDDNPDDRSLAIRELKRNFKNLEIEEIIDKNDFNSALERRDYDLVITDYRIRWTDGLKVLREVKNRKPDCPVIMFTGTGSEEIAMRAIKSGLHDYVIKSPKHFVRLSGSVHSAIEDIKKRDKRKELENLYVRLFERVPIPMYSVSVEGELLAANQAMLDLFGLKDKEEFFEHDATDFYADPKQRSKEIKLLEQQGEVKGFELQLENIIGETIWVRDYAYSTKDDEGNILYIEGSMEDITAQKKSEIKLHENKIKIEKLHEVVHAMESCETKDQVYKVALEAANNILDFNVCTIHTVEDDQFVVKATKGGPLTVGTRLPIEGIAGRSYEEKMSFLIDDITKNENAEPVKEDYRSALSVPIGDEAVFLTISYEEQYYDHEDLRMAEILVSHIREAIGRIEFTEKISSEKKKVKELHHATSRMERCEDREELVELIFDAAEQILGFNWCSAFLAEGDGLTALGSTHRGLKKGTILSSDEGIRGKTYQNKRSYLVNDITKDKDAKPTSPEFLSVISVPVGDIGVIQILSDQKYYFEQTDVEFIEILASHFSESLQRLKNRSQLEESENRYRMISESSLDLIAIMDYQGMIHYANKAFERFHDYEPEDIQGKIIFDFIDEDDQEKVSKTLRKMKKGEKYENVKFRMKDKEGKYHHFQAIGQEMEGRDDRIMIIARDIEDQVKYEKEIKKTKSKIKKLHDVVPELLQCENEEDMYKVTIKAAKDIFGFNISAVGIVHDENFVLEEVIGTAGKGKKIPVEEGIIGRTYREKRSFLIDDVQHEPDKLEERYKYRSVISVPIGDIGVYQAVSYDEGYFDETDLELAECLISHLTSALERLRFEKELEEKETRYRTIFENTGTAMAVIDGDKIFMANKEVAKLIGFDQKELKGKKWIDFIRKDDLDRILDYHRKRKEDPESVPDSYSFKLINRYGDARDVHLKITLIPDTDMSLVSIFDITHHLKNLSELEKMREKYRVIFDESSIGMALLTPDGKIKEFNRSFIFTLNADEKDIRDSEFKGYMQKEEEIREFDDILEKLKRKDKEKSVLKADLKNKDQDGLWMHLLGVYDDEGELEDIFLQLINIKRYGERIDGK